MTIYSELGKTLKLQRKDEETIDEFSRRATKKINDLSEEDWKGLSGPVQTWSNQVLMAIEANRKEPELPELEGWPQDEAVDDETEGDDAEAAEGEGDGEEAAEEEEGDGEEAEETEEEGSDGEEAEASEGEGSSDEESTSDGESEPEQEAAEAAPVRKKLNTGKKAGKKAPSTKTEKEKTVKTSAKKKEEPAKTAAPKAKTTARATTNGSGKRSGTINENARIKLLVKENPHREGTGRYARWKKYKENMTVGAALKAGLNRNNIRFSVEDGHIKIVE